MSSDPRFPELPFTAIREGQEGAEDGVIRPLYGDGTLGEPDPTLKPRLQAGEFGHFKGIIGAEEFIYVPFLYEPHMTPFGPTAFLSNDRELEEIAPSYDKETNESTDATRAELRRHAQGHYGFYDDATVYWILYNEGTEYGICSYTDVENFNEQVRPLALAAEAAIDARMRYLEELADNEEPDPTRIDPLIAAAEQAKQALIDYLQPLADRNGWYALDTEPWSLTAGW